MKTLIMVTILATILSAGTALKAQENPQEYLGLPGDNLNLYAVMKIFQESKNLEVFERRLNDPDNRINNLDLNGDNLVDYIMVYDNVGGTVHYIVLRVAINRNESQDVAVFTVQRYANGEVYIQLTGDEALYGPDYIVEPASHVVMNYWPVVRYIYRPNYILWHSSFYWDYYPVYWNPWRPFFWHYYYGYHYNWHNDYYRNYHRGYAHHDSHWNDNYYVGHRVYSPAVTRNLHSGNYRSTYSHPEQRKEGETVYNNNHPDQGRRSTYSNSTNTTVNRNNNSTVTGRRSTGSETVYRNNNETVNSNSDRGNRTLKDENTARRAAGTVTRSTVSSSGSGRTISEGRTTTQTSARPASRPEMNQNVSKERTTTQASARPASRPEMSQNVSKERTSTQTSRPASRPEMNQSVSSGRSSAQTRSEAVSSERRSSGGEKQVKSNNSSEKESKSETSSASRRK